jgi:hypothetical protein
MARKEEQEYRMLVLKTSAKLTIYNRRAGRWQKIATQIWGVGAGGGL